MYVILWETSRFRAGFVERRVVWGGTGCPPPPPLVYGWSFEGFDVLFG